MTRWALLFDAATRHYVLSEYRLVEGRWTVYRRSSWHTIGEAMAQIAERHTFQ